MAFFGGKMKIRYLAVAFIENKDRWLMMKRHGKHRIAANVWAPVGGHIEPLEMSHPERAIQREVLEETGLKIDPPKLQYVVFRKKRDEIRIQYVYFLKSDSTNVNANEEGELHWLSHDDLMSKETTFTTKEIINRYFTENDHLVYVGVTDDQPTMTWSLLEDWQDKSII